MTSDKLARIKSFHQLPDDRKKWLVSLAETYPLSFQQLNLLSEYSVDMICWDAGSLSQFYDPETALNRKGKPASTLIFEQLRQGYEGLKNGQRAYPEPGSVSTKDPKFFDGQDHISNCSGDQKQRQGQSQNQSQELEFPDDRMVKVDLQGAIMGKCPVASEKTRCCNLNTLDAVHQCGFDCSYCSIQSFYHGHRVRFIRNLATHLDTLSRSLDPGKPYHIGTGQSSDSLMWGNRFGLLDALYRFASKNPNVVLEMKSKSGKIDHILAHQPPSNMVFTWSLNTPVAIRAEEKGTAPLHKRLESARKLADRRIPVGFHFHPIIWYQGWEEDYKELVSQVTNLFQPHEVVMVSLGTLTFIKSVLKKIRERMLKSAILQMPMEGCAGKLSYPFEIKRQLFTTVYNAFPELWRKDVFFYMCMEDIDLWKPVFGRAYGSNDEFEKDMMRAYQQKMAMITDML